MIVAAAITQDGKIWTGTRHNEIISKMVDEGLPTPIKGEQGFVDETGKFYDRHEAGQHAIEAGQIPFMRWPGMGLDSVEIYPRTKKIEESIV